MNSKQKALLSKWLRFLLNCCKRVKQTISTTGTWGLHFFLNNKYFKNHWKICVALKFTAAQRQHRANAGWLLVGMGRKDGLTAAIKQEKRGECTHGSGDKKGTELHGKERNQGTIIRKSHWQKLQMIKKEAPWRKLHSLSQSPRKWKKWKVGSKDIPWNS